MVEILAISADGVNAPESELESLVPVKALSLARRNHQKAIPAFARDPKILRAIEQAVRQVPTRHELILGDSRHMDQVPDESVHLVATSPPYWTLKKYPTNKNQLGNIADFDAFVEELDKVWRHVLRVLVPGGRLIVVVGDVCLPRRRFGRHVVFPLHAAIQEHCRAIGFDNL